MAAVSRRAGCHPWVGGVQPVGGAALEEVVSGASAAAGAGPHNMDCPPNRWP